MTAGTPPSPERPPQAQPQATTLPPEVVRVIADHVYDLWRREMQLAAERAGHSFAVRTIRNER
jgi:hypothetical protein